MLPPHQSAYMAGKRDLRIDLLRGAAIVAMVVDHVGGDESWLYSLTGGNRFYVSAAEAFLFLSGVVTGIVYGGVVARRGLGPAIMKMLRRAAVLYAWTVGLTVLLPVIAARLDLGWEDPFQATSPLAYTVSVLTLHRTYHLVDILLVYVLLFTLGGLALALVAERRTAVMLGLSWGAWAAWQIWPQYASLPWAIEGMDVFNVAPWQALFFTGLAIGAHRDTIAATLARLRLSAYSTLGAAGVAAGIWLYRHELEAFLATAPRLDAQSLADYLFSKADLRIGRLMMFGFLAVFAFSLVTLGWGQVERWLGWLLIPLGQNSLTAYALHLGVVACLTKVGMAVFGEGGRGPQENALLQATGVMVMWLIVQAYMAVVARRNVLRAPTAQMPSETPRAGRTVSPVPVAAAVVAREGAVRDAA